MTEEQTGKRGRVEKNEQQREEEGREETAVTDGDRVDMAWHGW